ncbi:hypothetical protein DKX38_005479 [Salix brachista]|uniref:Uncharacterized protein n=1 Tax=Salix brachista TaxID=2182728 RepID=A0A5N5N073_9ROSI|nr:hypothetical protein DKX38_005479 [Salix brachista]
MTVPSGSGVPAPMLEGKYKAIIACWFLGLGSLVSWNSILTIEDYYYDLFPVEISSFKGTYSCFQPFALGTMALLAYNEAKIKTRKRNIAGYMLFTATTLMLIGSFCVGLAASGALASALRLLTKAVFEKSKNGLRKGVMLFLAISTFLEFPCVLLYAFLFPRLPIVKFYRAKAASEGSKTKFVSILEGYQIRALLPAADGDKPPERLSNKELFLQNTDYALELFLIYVLTLSIFPGFLYEDIGKHQLGSWYSLVLVAVFNVWDLISRYIPLVECFKLASRKGLIIGK